MNWVRIFSLKSVVTVTFFQGQKALVSIIRAEEAVRDPNIFGKAFYSIQELEDSES